VTLESAEDLAAEPFSVSRSFGSFVLVDPDSRATVAAGVIESADERLDRTAQLGGAVPV